ncbi:MAG: hypothetical protein M0030_23775 [Actinomycetota bacterium]|nr:hypothetical protein [Actinomycetota bacterium]
MTPADCSPHTARKEPDGPAVRDLLDAEPGTLVVSPFVLAEVDYLLMSRAGIAAELTLLSDLANDVYQVAAFTSQDAEHVEVFAGQHADLKLGIADAHAMGRLKGPPCWVAIAISSGMTTAAPRTSPAATAASAPAASPSPQLCALVALPEHRGESSELGTEASTGSGVTGATLSARSSSAPSPSSSTSPRCCGRPPPPWPSQA